MIEQDDRPVVDLLRTRHRLFQRFDLVDPSLAILPGGIEQLVAQRLRFRHIPVRDDADAEAGIADIGVREAGEQGCSHRLAFGFHVQHTFL